MKARAAIQGFRTIMLHRKRNGGAFRPPWGFLAACLMILGIESRLASRGDLLVTYSGLGSRFASKAAVEKAPDAAILGFGDSVLKFGFDPEAIRAATGLKAYNLAVPGTPPPLALALFERALKAGAKPRAVVLGMLTLGGDPSVHVNDFAEAFTIGDAFKVARDADSAELFGRIVVASWLPSLRYRQSLRGTILGLFQRNLNALDPSSVYQSPAIAKLKTWTEHSGQEPRERDGRFDGQMEPELERRLFANPWQVEASFEKGLRRFAKVASEHRIPLFWVVPPISPIAQARREALGFDIRHTRNLRAILQRIPNAILLDSRPSGYPATAFFDSCHLNAEGAAQLSHDIGMAIAKAGPTTLASTRERWLNLPTYPGQTTRDAEVATRKGLATGRR